MKTHPWNPALPLCKNKLSPSHSIWLCTPWPPSSRPQMQHSALCCLLQMHCFAAGASCQDQPGDLRRGGGEALRPPLPPAHSHSGPPTLLGAKGKCLPDSSEVEGWLPLSPIYCLPGLNSWQSLKQALLISSFELCLFLSETRWPETIA